MDESLRIAMWILAGLYLLLLVASIIQLIRIHVRAPDLQWTTQKVFLVLTVISSSVRVIYFTAMPIFYDGNASAPIKPPFEYPVWVVLDEIPSITFFTTYALLMLFWAEVIYHTRHQPLRTTSRLRPMFALVTTLVAIVQILFWFLLFLLPNDDQQTVDIANSTFLAAMYLVVAVGFCSFGGRLFFLLRKYPIDSYDMRMKLYEVGLVVFICTICFLTRAAVMLAGSFFDLINENAWLVGIYYVIAEILPSSMILFLLRALPERPNSLYINYQHQSAPTSPILQVKRFDNDIIRYSISV